MDNRHFILNSEIAHVEASIALGHVNFYLFIFILLLFLFWVTWACKFGAKRKGISHWVLFIVIQIQQWQQLKMNIQTWARTIIISSKESKEQVLCKV